MWHPSPEDLARLVDQTETPTAAEAEHLAACASCAAELDALRTEHDALGSLPRILPVPTSWEIMRHRLEREGMLHAAAPRRTWMPGVAAAIVLFVAGGATGVAFARGLGESARDVEVASSADVPAPASSPITNALDTATASVAQPPLKEPATTERAPAPRLAASEPRNAIDDGVLPSLRGTPSDAPTGTPDWAYIAASASNARTPDEAARFVRDAEGAYLAAMTRLAELTEAQSSDPAVRLATAIDAEGMKAELIGRLARAVSAPVS